MKYILCALGGGGVQHRFKKNRQLAADDRCVVNLVEVKSRGTQGD